MLRKILSHLAICLAIVAAFVLRAEVAVAETKIGTSIESRILLAFKATDASVDKFLPSGWASVTLAKGPVGGANLLVVLADRHLMLDGEGKPDTPAYGPTVAFVAYGRKSGSEAVQMFVIRAYEEPPVADPYGNSVSADIDRVSQYRDAGDGGRSQSETWSVKVASGGDLDFGLVNKIGRLTWTPGGESRPHSAADPDHFRIYRYDQLATVVMSEAMGLKVDGEISFKSTDPVLSGIFDGNERLVSILSMPTYIRWIFTP